MEKLIFKTAATAIFVLQVTVMLPTKCQVNWPFGSGEDAKNRFSRWLLRRPSWISDQIDFSHFKSTSHRDASFCFKSFGSEEEV